MANLEIQNAFLEGLNEVYSIMFTTDLDMLLMDVSTEVNIYGEAPNKVFRQPIKVTAKILLSSELPEEYIKEVKVDAVISLPTKQLLLNNIPHSTQEDLKELERVRFKYQDQVYEVNSVTPKTLVADMWQIYEFKCSLKR